MSGYVPASDARLAASLLLLRDDDDGLQVLMMRRAERDGDFRSGAAVFPGGVVDARDRHAHGFVLGPGDADLSTRLGVAEGGLDFVVAALRESFEEVGLLLATDLAGDPFDAAARMDQLHPWRGRLNDGLSSAAEFCQHFGLRLDGRGLAYYSHWLTPPGMPRRFDTRFFCALAPQGQEATADQGEAVELMWLTPAQALQPERGLKLLPVTRSLLQDLARFGRAADAHGEALQRKDIALTMPRVGRTRRGTRIVLPDELPYAEIARLDPSGRGDVAAEIVAGEVVVLSPRVRRITAPNAGPMTGPGTNSYLVGDPASSAWTVIDPGPADESHVQALLAAAAPGRIERILVTHTHRDHSPGAVLLARLTGAPVLGWVAAHPQWQDPDFQPDAQPHDGDRLQLGPETTLRVLHTPGHASNHLCYLLEQERLLFTGDHVMQGSTVVINPPDGDMSAYLRSLRALLDEDLQWLAPGHGFLVARPHDVLRGLIAHRLRREAKVLRALQRHAPCTVDTLLPEVYDDVPAALHGVAARSLLAHLLKLRDDHVAACEAEVWSLRSAPAGQGGA